MFETYTKKDENGEKVTIEIDLELLNLLSNFKAIELINILNLGYSLMALQSKKYH